MPGSFNYCVSQSLFEAEKEISYEGHGGVKFISDFDRVGVVNQTSIRERQRDEQTTNRLQGGRSLASHTKAHMPHTHKQFML